MESGEFSRPTPPPPPPVGSHDLQLAIGTQDDYFDCGDSPFSTETTGPMSLVSVSLAEPLNHDGENYCVKNAGAEPARLHFALANLRQTEVGCSADEALVETGSKCTPQGELADHMTISVWPFGKPGDPCAGEKAFRTGTVAELSDSTSITVLQPGEVCVLFFRFHFEGDDDAKVLSHRDAATFDLVFTGSDVPTAPPPPPPLETSPPLGEAGAP